MRLCFVTPQFIIGGAEKYIIAKTEWLVNNGHTVVIISNGGCAVNELPDTVKHIKFRTEISRAAFTKKSYEAYLIQLSDIIKKEKIELIEVHNSSPIVHVASAYKYHNTPFVINILNELSFRYNPYLKSLVRVLYNDNLIYTLTIGMKTYIDKYTNRDSIYKIIPIPIKETDIRIDEKLQNIILTVCRLEKDKIYVISLIKEFEKCMAEVSNIEKWELHIVGNGSLYDEIKNIADSINMRLGYCAIKLCGTLLGKELERKYSVCSIYVGMGTSLLFAAKIGRPCIIAGIPPYSDRYAWGLWGNNVTDYNVICGNEDVNLEKIEYSKIIHDLIVNEDLRISAGEKARMLYNKHYSFEHIMLQWNKEYEKVSSLNWYKIGLKLYEYDRRMRTLHYLFRGLFKLKRYLID